MAKKRKLIVEASALEDGQTYGKGGVRDSNGFTELYGNPTLYEDDLAVKAYEAEKSRNEMAAERLRMEQKRLDHATSQNMLDAERQKKENLDNWKAYEEEKARRELIRWGLRFGSHVWVNRKYYWYKICEFVRQLKELKEELFPADHIPRYEKILMEVEKEREAEKSVITEIDSTVFEYSQDADDKEVRMHLMMMVYHHMEAAKHLKAASSHIFPEDSVMRQRFESLATDRVLECINRVLSQDTADIDAEIIQGFCSMLGRESLTDENGVYVPIQLYQLRMAMSLDPVAA